MRVPKFRNIVLLTLSVLPVACMADREELQGIRSRYEMDSDTQLVDGVWAKFRHLPPRQLLDTAKYFDARRQLDTALICYSLIINTPEKKPAKSVKNHRNIDNGELHRLKIDALNRSAVVYYYWLSDYPRAYRLLIDARDLSEIHPHPETEFKIHANIGNIYYHLKEYRMAGRYYSRALELCPDSISIMRLHNNIAAAKAQSGELDSAFVHIERSLDISNRHDRANLYSALNTAATIYQRKGDSAMALHCLTSALDEARKNGKIEYEANNLSDLGELLFEMGRPKEAESYIVASNAIAEDNNLSQILLENHLLLARIERSRGRYKHAVEHMDRYNGLKDSLFSSDRLANLNQLQRIGEVSKANRQIETLAVEQRVKERTIGYQKVIMSISFAVLVMVVGVLLIVFGQKRKLNKAYRVLVAKNREIMELSDGAPRKIAKKPPPHQDTDGDPKSTAHQDGDPKSTAHQDGDGELAGRILAVMEDTEVICNPKFSINMLSSLVGANHIYVSQVINNTMGKNFRALLNEYRIREAQRLFAEPDASKYTIESVSLQLGYKSQNTFRAAFQEITGVSPSFYLKSMHETL